MLAGNVRCLRAPESHRSEYLWDGGANWESLMGTRRWIHYHLALYLPSLRRVLDRNPRTQARSPAHPLGIPPLAPGTARDNAILENVIELLFWMAARTLGGCTLEAPTDSYLWRILDARLPADISGEDVDCSMCMFGHTRHTGGAFEGRRAAAFF